MGLVIRVSFHCSLSIKSCIHDFEKDYFIYWWETLYIISNKSGYLLHNVFMNLRFFKVATWKSLCSFSRSRMMKLWFNKTPLVLLYQPPWDTQVGDTYIIHYTYGCDYTMKVLKVWPFFIVKTIVLKNVY